jgi:DNA-binding GntR family transcriptional regulator
MEAVPLEIPSVEESVYRLLRRDITRLALAPDERLFLEGLSARYGVSMTPIRQALRRLEAEGLVASVPHRGARVAPLTIGELEEIQLLRLGVEPFLARHGAERATDDALAEMAAEREAMERAHDRGDLEAYLGTFWSVRDACYRCAERPRLERVLADQRARVERYVLFLCADVEAASKLRQHPDRLIDAARARDGAAAEASTREALLWVLSELGRMLDESAAPAEEATA